MRVRWTKSLRTAAPVENVVAVKNFENFNSRQDRRHYYYYYSIRYLSFPFTYPVGHEVPRDLSSN